VRQRPQSVQGARGVLLDRAGRATEHVGCLRLAEIVEEAKHHHRALPRGQLPQQAEHRVPHDDVLGAVPRDVVGQRRVRLLGARTPTPPRSVAVDDRLAHVRLGRLRPSQPMPTQVGLGERALQDVFRAMNVTDDEVRRPCQRGAALPNERRERLCCLLLDHRAGPYQRNFLETGVNQNAAPLHQEAVTTKLARIIALTAAPLTLTAVACSSSGGSIPTAQSTTTPPVVTTPPATTEPTPENTACALTANSAAKPPSFWPTSTDATWFETNKQGSTTQWFAYAPGDDVKARRDAIKKLFTDAGYEVKGTDAEDNEEAEGEFEGKGHGELTVQVIPREGCDGQLRIRYRGTGGD
jgi:hypothetical protein